MYNDKSHIFFYPKTNLKINMMKDFSDPSLHLFISAIRFVFAFTASTTEVFK